jgi:hypothetical protein
MEFVFVDLPTSRRVDLDGQLFGVTNRTLSCAPGGGRAKRRKKTTPRARR